MNSRLCWAMVLAVSTCSFCTCLQAQQFLLTTTGLTSKAYLTEAKLDVIDAQGAVNTYLRDLNFDSADGQWIGYRNKESGRILRWPTSNTGSLQIGTFQGNQLQYTASKMQIRPIAGGQVPTRPTIPGVPPGAVDSVDPFAPSGRGSEAFQESVLEYQSREWKSFARSDLFSRVLGSPINRLPNPQPIHLISYDAKGSPWAIAQRGARLGCISQVSSQAIWWVAPAGPGMVRLQMQNNGQVWAISALDRGALRLSLVSQDPRQLWRVCSGHFQPNHYMLENAFFVGNYLTHLGVGNLGLQPLLGVPTQLWVPLTPPPTYLPMLQPFWRNVSREVRPNPPLPPAEVELMNSHKYALIILVGDLRSGQQISEVRVEPMQSTTITVERDAGSTLVEVVEIMTVGGGWNRQEYITQIPPVSLYDLSVYEEFLQSIAIDRTGKSPNPIEDINYVPKSLGLLVLSAGESLPERGQLDVYAEAKSANNAGAVRRIDPKRLEKPKADPLESILEGIQNQNQPKDAPRRF